jgi:hypothetical protein
MAQNVWLNATVDPAISKKIDSQDHNHTVVGGTAAASDVTLSYDSAKIANVSQLRSVVNQLLRAALSRLPL